MIAQKALIENVYLAKKGNNSKYTEARVMHLQNCTSSHLLSEYVKLHVNSYDTFRENCQRSIF